MSNTHALCWGLGKQVTTQLDIKTRLVNAGEISVVEMLQNKTTDIQT